MKLKLLGGLIDMNLKDKVAIITGAAGGIGKQATKMFSEAGAKVVLVDLHQDKLEEIVSETGLKSGDYLTVAADVTQEKEVKNYVDETLKTFKTIDTFFNNAGIDGEIGSLVDSTVENLDNLYNVNTKGIFLGIKHVLPVMMEQKYGSIINMSSILGLMGLPGGQGQYGASKHAVTGLTKTAAIESAETGVRVNAICPAQVNTQMIRSIEKGISPDNPEEAKEQFIKDIPMKRYAEPEDIVNAAMFLASDRSTFITGVALPVDGGITA